MLVECEDCKQKFDIGSREDTNQVTHKKEYVIDGQSMFLTHYDCPSCGRRHYVQIDNEVSLHKLSEERALFVKLSIAKKKGKQIPTKQLAKFKRTQKDLSNYRLNLMKQYAGKSVYDERIGEHVELRFSI